MKDLKTNVPDTLVSLLLVVLSFFAVFALGMLQVVRLIVGRRSEGKIVDDPASLAQKNIWYKVQTRRITSRI